jgi:Asp-tRNA(Asn)/Glu-tRNA(Gln) amidotransferase A subunit family amidase
MFSEYGKHDALGLAELVKQRQVSATELVDTCIARIEKVNPALNAVITPMYDEARAAARAMRFFRSTRSYPTGRGCSDQLWQKKGKDRCPCPL